MRFYQSLTLIICLFYACNSKKDEVVIAEVFDQKLYQEDLNTFLNKNSFSEEDSNIIINEFVQSWIENKTISHYAILSTEIDLKSIEQKTLKYKEELLEHHYQNYKIKTLLDTNISNEEIKNYYDSHKEDFQLKDYLVKVLYIKLQEDAPNIDEISKWYKLKKETDFEKITNYVNLYASNFYFDKKNWIFFDEITKEIPLNDINKDKFITRKSMVKFQEDGFYYFLNIIDYKLKNSDSPLEFEKENIKNRILNQRIYTLRTQVNLNLINQAKNENAIKKY